MTKQLPLDKTSAEYIVAEWESRLDDLVLIDGELVALHITADSEYEGVFKSKPHLSIRETEYLDAKRLLQAQGTAQRNKPRGGRPSSTDYPAFFAALGRVLASATPRQLQSDEGKQKIISEILNEYEESTGRAAHSHADRWLRRFLDEYTNPSD